MKRDHRQIFVRFMSCDLPLAIETGRFTKPQNTFKCTPVSLLLSIHHSTGAWIYDYLLLCLMLSDLLLCLMLSDILFTSIQKVRENKPGKNENFDQTVP